MHAYDDVISLRLFVLPYSLTTVIFRQLRSISIASDLTIFASRATLLSHDNSPAPSTATMTTPARESNIDELKEFTIRDREDTNKLVERISKLRIAMEEGTSPEVNNLDIMEQSNRDITITLVPRIEAIERNTENQDATDREMLQALNERLWECDRKSSKLAELRDLQLSIRSSTQKPFGVSEESKHDDDSTETKKTVAPEHKIHEEGSASKHSDHAYDMNDRESEYSDSVYSQDEYEPDVDKNAWPLLYQIMDIDPGTSKADIGRLLNRYVTMSYIVKTFLVLY